MAQRGSSVVAVAARVSELMAAFMPVTLAYQQRLDTPKLAINVISVSRL